MLTETQVLDILKKLDKALTTRAQSIQRYDDYYCGKHPLAFASEKFRKAFGGLFNEFADNWCDLVVDSVEERLNVEGFRFGDATAGDEDAWRIWQANDMDAGSQLAHTEALICGTAYGLVWPTEDETTPQITVEHPTQAIIGYQPGNRRNRVAGLKLWLEDDGYYCATVYTADALWKFKSQARSSDTGGVRTATTWVRREVDGEAWPLPNTLGVVPLIELPNKPRMLKPGMSEIHKVIPIQDAVNKIVADLLVTSEYQSFRQRWATGIEIPRDPETGQEIEQFEATMSRLWRSEDKDAKFGEFSPLDPSGFVKAIELLVQHIASQTRTPPHYFALTGTYPSGESIKSAETGLVAKARRKMRFFGEGWEEIIRLALFAAGNAAATDVAVETMWGDPESRTEAEHIDALVKKRALGIPLHQLWEDVPYTPTQIARFDQMLADEAARASIAGFGSPLFDADLPADGSDSTQPPAE